MGKMRNEVGVLQDIPEAFMCVLRRTGKHNARLLISAGKVRISGALEMHQALAAQQVFKIEGPLGIVNAILPRAAQPAVCITHPK